MNEQHLSIHKALAAAQAEVRNPPEETKGQYGMYASLQSVLDTLRPVWSKHGLAVVQHPVGDQLITDIYHESGGHLQIVYPLLIQEIQKNQNPSHRMGAAMTYARRYSLNAIFGTQGDLDSDNDEENEKRAAVAVKAEKAVAKAEKATAAPTAFREPDIAAIAEKMSREKSVDSLAFTTDPLFDEYVAETARINMMPEAKVRHYALEKPEAVAQKFYEWKGAPRD